MKYLPVLVALVLLVAAGVAALVYGEADDAPGLQLIGGVLVIGAAAIGVRTVARNR